MRIEDYKTRPVLDIPVKVWGCIVTVLLILLAVLCIDTAVNFNRTADQFRADHQAMVERIEAIP